MQEYSDELWFFDETYENRQLVLSGGLFVLLMIRHILLYIILGCVLLFEGLIDVNKNM